MDFKTFNSRTVAREHANEFPAETKYIKYIYLHITVLRYTCFTHYNLSSQFFAVLLILSQGESMQVIINLQVPPDCSGTIASF